MKFGIRTPSIKKSIKARTTGRAKRIAKSAINPLYGAKGVGYIKSPKKAAYNKIYNKIYNKTTVDAFNNVKNLSTYNNSSENYVQNGESEDEIAAANLAGIILGIILIIPIIISILIVWSICY